VAAIDLSDITKAPWPHTFTASDGVWQEVKIPDWADADVIPEGDGFMSFSEAGVTGSLEAPTDGAAVGTNRFPVVANGVYGDFWPQQPANERQLPELLPKSLFIAGDGAAISVTVVLKRLQVL